MPDGSITILNKDFPRLLNSLMSYLSDGFIFNKGYGKEFLFKFGQAAKKQPMEGVNRCLNSHLKDARNADRLYNDGTTNMGGRL